MYTAAYDNRKSLPHYFLPFLANTTRYCDLNLISPMRQQVLNRASFESKYSVNLVSPRSLPQFQTVTDLFDQVFVNYSTNTASFEKACFQRWFALNAATTHLTDDEYVCLLDTDFLIGMSPSDVLTACQTLADVKRTQYIAEWVGKVPEAVGPEITIMTKGFLHSFCKYLLTTYYSPEMQPRLLEEYYDVIGGGNPGGICDMRAFAAFYELNQDCCFNLQELKDPLMIRNFNSFVKQQTQKNEPWKLCFQNGVQTLRIADDETQLLGIHFQGSAKNLMHFVHADVGDMTREACEEFLEVNRPLLKRWGDAVKKRVRA